MWDCIFKFALNFRPQSIFLRDRGKAFVIVRVTSAPSPILEVLGGFAKGVVRHERSAHEQAGAQRCLSATDGWDEADLPMKPLADEATCR